MYRLLGSAGDHRLPCAGEVAQLRCNIDGRSGMAAGVGSLHLTGMDPDAQCRHRRFLPQRDSTATAAAASTNATLKPR